MMFSGWKIGLDIQMEGVRVVAVQKRWQGWQLRQWWHLPFPSQVFAEDILSQPAVLSEVLRDWRTQLPRRYRLCVSFPSTRTFQRKIPIPDKTLSEEIYEHYVAHILSQQLQTPTSQLCYDYFERKGELQVTAARHSDVDTLISCLTSAQLFPDVVTPCDKVLCMLPMACYPQNCHYLVHEEPHYWLWTSRNRLGISGVRGKCQSPDINALCTYLATAAEYIALSTSCTEDGAIIGYNVLDVWQVVTSKSLSLPNSKGRYTIALGLALGAAI